MRYHSSIGKIIVILSIAFSPLFAMATTTASVASLTYNKPATSVAFDIFLGNSTGFTSQVIVQCTGPNNFSVQGVGSQLTNPAEYVAPCAGLTPSTNYTYVISSADGTSFPSITSTFTTPAATLGNQPGGETYAIGSGPTVTAQDNGTFSVTVAVNITNPVADQPYAIQLGHPSGTSCIFDPSFNDTGATTSNEQAPYTRVKTWTVSPNTYCIGVQYENAAGTWVTGIQSLPGGNFTVSATTISSTPPSTPTPNSTGCVSSDNSTYCMLAPLPGIGDATGKVDLTKGVGSYINGIIQLVLGLIGVLAVLMIVVGGIEYMSTVSMGEKEGAKSRITNALLGLLLALTSYLILNTINPDLVNLNITVPGTTLSLGNGTAPITNGGVVTGGTGGGGNAGTTTTGTSTTTGVSGASLSDICLDPSPIPDCTGIATSCSQYAADINKDISDPALAAFLKANMVEESGCNINAVGFDGAGSYGIFQQLASTAQANASGCSVSGTINQSWLSNPANIDADICIQANFVRSLESSCGNNWRDVAAAQGAGPGACIPSADCANETSCVPNNPVQAWECPWDDVAHTVANTGMQYAVFASKKMTYCLDHPASWAQ